MNSDSPQLYAPQTRRFFINNWINMINYCIRKIGTNELSDNCINGKKDPGKKVKKNSKIFYNIFEAILNSILICTLKQLEKWERLTVSFLIFHLQM